MPVALRSTNSRAEAKYNVTTEFPSHGLHAAAATGNVGLVEYALSRGQPVNSVLDGVLPLHAACAGGTPLHNVVVKKLIEHGADVNAPRLPRRYSNEKNRDTSQPIVGASGSTPLHFAAANGNTGTINILLKCGAVPDRPDKHGVTPEMLARRNGWLECADVLHDWTNSQNRDLLEKEESFNATATSADGETPVKRRIQMKRSVEHALHILKPSSSQLFESRTPPSPQEQGVTPLGQYTFYSNTPAEVDPSTRRPSLPQSSMLPSRMRKSSAQSITPFPPSSTRRPSSAGSDAERPHSPMAGTFTRNPPQTLRKGSKVSLLNLFKKSQQACDSPERFTTSLPPFDVTPTPSRPIPISTPERLTGESSSPRRAVDLHNALAMAQQAGQFDYEAAAQGSHIGLGSRKPSNTFRPGHLRDRSGSRSSASAVNRGGTVFEHNVVVTSGTELLSSTPPKRPPGPGILRNHHRSTSGMGTGAVRSLRFDSTSSSGRHQQDSDAARLRASNSTGSLSGRSATADPKTPPVSAPATKTDFSVDEADKDDDEEEYGQIINAYTPALKVSRTESMTGSDSSFSPVIDSAESAEPEESHSFPFSINRPPLMTFEDGLSDLDRSKEGRNRGASFSSTDTNPGMSSGESAAGTTRSPVVSPQNSGGLPSIDDVTPASSLSPEIGGGSFAGRRPQTPIEIDIRDISSHAQAEELVQRTQQCILDMEHHSDDEGSGPDWTPLSARLAAYGKSLAVERKFREERDRKLSEPVLESPTSPQPSTNIIAPPTASPLAQPKSLPTPTGALGRQSSLKSAPRPAKRVSGPRRPNTSSGTPEREGGNSADLFLTERRLHSFATAGKPRSASSRSPSPLPTRRSVDHRHVDSEDEFSHPIVRSHTPKPDYYNEELGLYRVTTTPAEHTARSSHKLVRMGFSKNPEPPVRSYGGRFGAIKSFFKGKA